ncbi:MAG TPA: outer membrane beta-barrel protein [Bacteroidia bacterium]|nr:outer membrane beta-barrel protein [Bacteroidia bacterium]
MDYLVLPVTVEFKFGSKKQYYFGSGGFVGYLLKHQLKYTELLSGYTQTNSIIENFERFDFGASFTAGVKIPLGKSFLSIQAEDHLGLVNIGDYVMDGVLKTNSLILLIGFTPPGKYP